MLVSYHRRFIFLKTRKTAGTSVEVLLEPYCDDDYAGPQHFRDEKISAAGIIGARGDAATTARYYNHAPASFVRAEVGEAIWQRYLKIACVRNPFDKAVSAFWFHDANLPRDMSSQILRERFLDFVMSGGLPIDWPVYSIDDEICVDQVIRYESLHDDVDRTTTLLGLPCGSAALGAYKTDFRPTSTSLADHYCEAAVERVRTVYDREFVHLGYDIALPST